ncbi:uncharacterized oxidoreductase SSP0419-like [Chironomus tepperi]|uniref:uncharacterized oxidoreductase SSP0419-like n=1 Tax=Chironomus tepperi TaxID=113505 RepID=UPI00391F775F
MDQIVPTLIVLKFTLVEILKFFPIFVRSIVSFFIPKSRKNVSGQLALITGGSEGLGRSIAFRLAQEGCNIAIANRNLEKGQKTAEEIRKKFNVKVQAFQCDVSKFENVRRLKEEVKKSLGTVDLLINNAGLLAVENSTLEGNDEDYQNIVDVNMTSWIFTTRAFLPDMIQQRRGHIVGISSLSVMCPIICSTAYISTKYANAGFMDGLREDMNLYGFSDFIKITTAFPGFIKTNDEYHEKILSNFQDCLVRANESEFVADKIVDGILKDFKTVYVSMYEKIYSRVFNSLPSEIKDQCFKSAMKSDKRDQFIKMKLKQCKLIQNDSAAY